MPSLPFAYRVILFAALALPLASCGKGDSQNSSAVAMNNLEVVDGTASDAMTDLDGVKSEGTPLAANATDAPGNNASRASAKNADPAENAADTEVIADQ
ncbi:MAG: hypothetical protein QHC67_06030 [Sphingobium sp.]|uniref:hypothetical protein n=1 Tax=Sphingobium sp. TaxID=1912891 RepID=UPI0029B2792B|nr:hypothetical protein [Sphingobium sp.]MDX3909362.1 hypothetical protein [Sphingobium sp.]